MTKFEYDFPMAANTATMVVWTDQIDFRELSNPLPKPLMLIGKRSDKSDAHPNEWSLPGGFLEVGKETLKHAASRELYEETYLRLSTEKWHLFFVSDDPGNDPRYDQVINSCFCQFVHKGLMSEAFPNDDLSDLKWVTFDEAEDLITAFNHKNIFEKFMQNTFSGRKTI